MFTLGRQMGNEMRPIARRTGATHQAQSSPRMTGQGYRAPFRPGRDYSKVKCFSCGHMGHTQARCPNPDSSLPAGWLVRAGAPLGELRDLLREHYTAQTGLELVVFHGPAGGVSNPRLRPCD